MCIICIPALIVGTLTTARQQDKDLPLPAPIPERPKEVVICTPSTPS